jgi:CheY-like chemotaxis protein
MVQGIVGQSGGYILIDSEPGRGTTFRIYLPRMEARPVTLEEVAPVETSPGKEAVLLVEDEDAVRKLVKRMLEKGGYTVLEARSGAEALSICESRQNQIDLLITDIVMPGMSGPALAEKAHEKCSGMKVLYVSGYTDEGARGAAIPRGSEFLAKPFSAAKVLHTVRRVLEKAA